MRTRWALTAFGALAGWAMLGSVSAAAPEPALATKAAEYRKLEQEHTLDALIEAVKQSTVSAQVPGRVVEINFDVDDFVPAGTVIIRLKNTEQRAGVEAAEASLREAQARHTEAETEHRRIADIYEKRLVAKAALDKAEADLAAARERLEAARATVKAAREQLGYTVITAPYSGVVVKRHIEIGEMASAGQPLMTGFSLDELRATATIPQNLIGAVRQHRQARILLPGQPGGIKAQALTFFPYADADSHSFRVRIALPRGVEGLYPGMVVKAALTTGMENRLVVPQTAVAHRSEVSAVYVVTAKGQVGFRQVRIGRRTGDGEVEILSGLEAGERVALDPVRAGIVLKQQRAGAR